MLGTPSFFYFIQLLNNWPRFFVFLWDNTILPIHAVIPISASRPEFSHKNGTPVVANSLEEFHRRYGLVEVSACSVAFPGAVIFAWEVVGERAPHQPLPLHTTHCRTAFNAPKQGHYTINLVVRDRDETILGTGTTSIQVRDRWIVALGDSYCSGEGNPDIPEDAEGRRAVWMNDRCHRSSSSWASRLSDRVHRSDPSSPVIFSFLCCTGASVEQGVLRSTPQQPIPQMAVVEQIANKFELRPDLVLLSVGGNDIGYAEILHALGNGHETTLFGTMHLRFMFASQQLDQLATRLSSLRPRRVLFPHYFDPSRDEHGNFDASCQDLQHIGSSNLRHAEEMILRRLNRMISAKCVENGWTHVDVSSVFQKAGICSRHSRIRTMADSKRLEGSTLGAFHPTAEAHAEIARLLWTAGH